MGVDYKQLPDGRWYAKGCNFIRYYNTKEEMEADKENTWELHMRNLRARKMVINMLLEYR